jgi:peptide/nickel transport system permease protein
MSETTKRGDRTLGGTDILGTPVDVSVNPPDEAPPTAKPTKIVGRSPGQLAWRRLRRDRTATISAYVTGFFILVAIIAPLIEWIYGYGPYVYNEKLLDSGGLPLGYIGGIDFSGNNASNHSHILGVEPGTGRDVFILIVYGIRTSLVVAFTASVLASILGVTVGLIAGYFGGWVDSVLSWVTDVALAFPFVLFAIAVIPVVNSHIADQYGEVSSTKRVVTVIVVFATFAWMSTARLVRGQVLSLREREYVDAARAVGASNWHIMFRQILPNIWAPILITFSLAVPATITGEAALSFLNIGVRAPTPDFGRMVSDSIAYMRADPMYMFIPGVLILLMVLAFNLLGDSLRDALDPKSTR